METKAINLLRPRESGLQRMRRTATAWKSVDGVSKLPVYLLSLRERGTFPSHLNVKKRFHQLHGLTGSGLPPIENLPKEFVFLDIFVPSKFLFSSGKSSIFLFIIRFALVLLVAGSDLIITTYLFILT